MNIHEKEASNFTTSERGRNILREWHKFSECHPEIHSTDVVTLLVRRISSDTECEQDENECREIVTSYDRVHPLVYHLDWYTDDLHTIANNYKELIDISKYWMSLTEHCTHRYVSVSDLLEFFNNYEWTYVYNDIVFPRAYRVYSKTISADLAPGVPLDPPAGINYYQLVCYD